MKLSLCHIPKRHLTEITLKNTNKPTLAMLKLKYSAIIHMFILCFIAGFTRSKVNIFLREYYTLGRTCIHWFTEVYSSNICLSWLCKLKNTTNKHSLLSRIRKTQWLKQTNNFSPSKCHDTQGNCLSNIAWVTSVKID